MARLALGVTLNLVDEFTRKMGRPSAALSAFTEQTIRAAAPLKALSIGLGAVGGAFLATGAAIALGTGLAIKKAADFQESMLDVQRTTGLSDRAIRNLSESMLDMSVDIPIAAVELGQIAPIAGQLGLQGKAEIEEFTSVVARMAAVTDVSSEVAAKSLAKISNLFGLDILENAEQLGSAMNELANRTTASVAELDNITRRFGGTANAIGITVQETLGLAAAMTDAGLTAEVTGTSLTLFFNRALRDTKKFAKAAGISSSLFEQTIRERPVDAMLMFADALGKGTESTQEMAQAMGDAGLRSAGLSRLVFGLSANIQGVRDSIEISNKAFEEATSLQAEFDNIVRGLNAQLQIFSNRFSKILIQVGDVFIPIITDLIKGVGIFLKIMGAFIDVFKILLSPLSLVTRSLGFLIKVLGVVAALVLGPIAAALVILFSIPLNNAVLTSIDMLYVIANCDPMGFLDFLDL